MNRRGLVAAALLSFAGCAAAPSDPFAAAQSAMRHDDLLAALLAYDAVPVSHPRYPEACAGVAAVEVRLQRGQELMLEGYRHRGERRDDAALRCFEQARSVWPALPGVDDLITATRRRLARTGGLVAGPTEAPIRIPLPGAPANELTVADHSLGSDAVAAPGEAARPLPVQPADESVVLGLVAVEARLGRGELEQAVVDLLELARRFPDDVRVQRRLARVLHQRALLRYGQGALTAALLDWERVLSIEPDNREVADLLLAVRAEAAAPSAPPR